VASIPGFRFDITGASGSTGLLGPKNSWRVYVLPRGGYASQDSTGTLITFDSAAVASRFAANNWLQRGLATADIRQVSAVGGNSISISGAALTVTTNDRIFLIGNTQPTITGGSATYTVPATLIRQRDDDGATLYTNSMITSNSDGLVQGFAGPNFYDCIIQDGNQANQGSIIDLALGAIDGVSTGRDALFGASLTVNGAIGVTGWATFGSTVTMNAAIGVTGWATFGSTVTMNAALGVTGVATLSGRAAFGHSVSIDGAFGVTGAATFGISGIIGGLSITTGIFGCSNQGRVLLALTNNLATANSTDHGVTWSTEAFDVGGFHASGSSYITIPGGYGGVYLLTAQIQWADGYSGFRVASIRKNDDSTSTVASVRVEGATTGVLRYMMSGIAEAVSADLFSVVVRQNSGSSQTVSSDNTIGLSHFGAVKIA
jgi:hypothetical protein